MSAHRRRLTIRVAARDDIKDILLYTEQRWGPDQRRRYRKRLFDAMRSLLDHPELGRARPEYLKGCRGLVVDHHVVFYRITDEAIVVGRVLHTSQDPTGKVTP